MAQLIKHYFINRETKAYAVDTKFGLMLPDIKGLDIIHRLTDENDIPYCLSTCPEYFEYTTTVSQEVLQELQSNPNITVVSSSEVSVEGETLYNVTYQEAYTLDQTEGLSVISQEVWDGEVFVYDVRQTEKRIEVLRSIRDEILSASDWVVVKSSETGISLSDSFKVWRQSLRDLPSQDQVDFPSELPPIAVEVENDANVLGAYGRWGEVTSIHMINDPTQTEVV
jgi:hypothetical protein